MSEQSFMTQDDQIQAQLITARRNQILDAATKVFAQKGFHRATIRDVAKEAGVADGTIYNYFDNKTDLVLGILDRLNETSQRAGDFERATHSDPFEWMRDYMIQRSETIGPQGFEVFQVLISEMLLDEKLRKLYVERIMEPTMAVARKYYDQWIADGVVKPLDPALAMRVISGTFLGLIVLRLLGDVELQARWNETFEVLTEIV